MQAKNMKAETITRYMEYCTSHNEFEALQTGLGAHQSGWVIIRSLPSKNNGMSGRRKIYFKMDDYERAKAIAHGKVRTYGHLNHLPDEPGTLVLTATLVQDEDDADKTTDELDGAENAAQLDDSEHEGEQLEAEPQAEGKNTGKRMRELEGKVERYVKELVLTPINDAKNDLEEKQTALKDAQEAEQALRQDAQVAAQRLWAVQQAAEAAAQAVQAAAQAVQAAQEWLEDKMNAVDALMALAPQRPCR